MKRKDIGLVAIVAAPVLFLALALVASTKSEPLPEAVPALPAVEEVAVELPVLVEEEAPKPEISPEMSKEELTARILKSSVRVRARESGNQFSTGSGTVIEQEGNLITILTCAHLFTDCRNLDGITVDLFAKDSARKIPAKLISQNRKRDTAILTAEVDFEVPVIPVAPKDREIKKGEPTATLGCDRGRDATVRFCKVVDVNRYLGPSTVEVSDLPVSGRSGGGLIALTDGVVLGVCNCADPDDHRGIYAGLPSVHEELLAADNPIPPSQETVAEKVSPRTTGRRLLRTPGVIRGRTN